MLLQLSTNTSQVKNHVDRSAMKRKKKVLQLEFPDGSVLTPLDVPCNACNAASYKQCMIATPDGFMEVTFFHYARGEQLRRIAVMAELKLEYK